MWAMAFIHDALCNGEVSARGVKTSASPLDAPVMTMIFINDLLLVVVNLEAVLQLADVACAIPSFVTSTMRNRALPCIMRA